MQRILAHLIDSVIFAVPFIIFLILEVFVGVPGLKTEIYKTLIHPASFFIYYVILEGTGSQRTIGKQMMNLKVVRTNGKKMDLITSLTRNVGKVLLSMTYLQGGLRLLIPGERQAVHDEFANCLVVEVRKV